VDEIAKRQKPHPAKKIVIHKMIKRKRKEKNGTG
jgi:hypothetical protein